MAALQLVAVPLLSLASQRNKGQVRTCDIIALQLSDHTPHTPRAPHNYSTMGTEIGTLVVVVLKARNLLDKHSFFKQDVYTKITLSGTTKQTKVDVKGGQHPEWDEELRFPVFESKKNARTLEVSCWSKEPRVDELVGKGEVDIAETLKTGEFDGKSSCCMISFCDWHGAHQYLSRSCG